MEFIHRFDDTADVEIAGFIASQFAYGKIELFKRFLDAVFERMGPRPYRFVEKGDFRSFKGLYYRFQKEGDVIGLFEVLRKIIGDFGGIGPMMESFYERDLRKALWRARRHLIGNDDQFLFFFPKPSNGNPMKRWNLFVRWMVRDDAIDAGLWNFMDRKDLVVPLDTHICKIGRCLRWTKRIAPSYAMARDITDVLKGFCPEDPLKYDFFLCHRVGIASGCTGKRSDACGKNCVVYGIEK